METIEQNTAPPPSDHAGSSDNKENTDVPSQKGQSQKKGVRFWAIIVAICVAGLLTALEATIMSTALPTIVSALGGADNYIWAVNGYFLTMTALQPLYGQLSNVFGRRWPTIIATATFTLGSGTCGGADNITTLIAGRAIQGIGAGGINVLVELIVCDLLPLRERGNYLALIFGVIAVGTALGPFFGGLIVQHASWRWVFYLNLPVGGFALVLLVFFLRVNYQKETTLATKLGRIDCLGDAIFVGSIVSTLIALSWAGTLYPWSSYRIIVSLVLGLLGLVGFFFFETSKFALSPTMPIRLFSNRTSFTAFVLTFLHSVVTMWALYFLPVYFQGVLGSGPSYSGVQLLPTILIIIPFAAMGGSLLAKYGRYRPIHHVGYALMVIGFGLLSLLDENSSTAKWVIFQVIESAGAGLAIPTLLPAVQAELTDADNALSTATWAFVRSFGLIWGSTIPAAIFNNRVDELSARISDPAVVAELVGGKAYEHATADFLNTLSSSTRAQVVSVFSEGLRRTWQVAIAFTALGFLLVILEKEVPLRKELNTEYGMMEVKEKMKNVSPADENLQTEAQA